MPITSTTSFYCRGHGLTARCTDLGPPDLGAVINICAEGDPLGPGFALFFDDVAYASRLAACINRVNSSPEPYVPLTEDELFHLQPE